MTKPNSITNSPPKEPIFRTCKGTVKSVSKVAIRENGDIRVVYSGNELFVSNMICCSNDIEGEVRNEILLDELQLKHDLKFASFLREKDRDDEAVALLIDMATRSEALALKYSSLYQRWQDKQMAITFMYKNHAYKYYTMAVSWLMLLIGNDKFKDKYVYIKQGLLAKQLVFVGSKDFSSSVVMRNNCFINRAKSRSEEIDVLLIKTGFDHLVDKKVMIKESKVKQDSSLPLFTPLYTLGGFISNFLISDSNQGAKRRVEPEIKMVKTIKSKKSME